MFQSLFKRAEHKIDSVLSKYLTRIAATVPLIIAGGFAIAAATIKLIELYGAVTACALMAALFAVVGLIAMAVVGTDAHANAETASAETAASASDETSPSSGDGPDLLASDLLTPEVKAFLSSAAPMALPSVARAVGRNLPLLLILALIGYVVSRFGIATGSAEASPSEESVPPEMAAAPPAA